MFRHMTTGLMVASFAGMLAFVPLTGFAGSAKEAAKQLQEQGRMGQDAARKDIRSRSSSMLSGKEAELKKDAKKEADAMKEKSAKRLGGKRTAEGF